MTSEMEKCTALSKFGTKYLSPNVVDNDKYHITESYYMNIDMIIMW